MHKEEFAMNKIVALGALAALVLWHPQPSLGQMAGEEFKAIRTEIEALKEGQTAIRKELQEIKNLLRAKQAAPAAEPQNIILSVSEAPFRGNKHAKLTLIDFSDFQ